jgi:hypothetical protein
VHGLPFNDLTAIFEAYLRDPRNSYRVADVLASETIWMKALSRPGSYVLVQVDTGREGPDRSYIIVHGGGGYGARPEAGLFKYLCEANTLFDYGGPWARVAQDGSAAYGWRTLVPSDLITDARTFSYATNMIDVMGTASRQIADAIIPNYGGRPIDERDPQALPALLSGTFPPEH